MTLSEQIAALLPCGNPEKTMSCVAMATCLPLPVIFPHEGKHHLMAAQADVEHMKVFGAF